MKKFLPLIENSLTSFWLGTTLLVDFFFVPTVFRTINNVAIAGGVGIKLFGGFNPLELVVAVILLGLSLTGQSKVKKTLAFFTLTIAASYVFWISPNIAKSREQMVKLAPQVESSTEAKANHQKAYQNQQFYHHLYVKVDGVKILLLMALLVICYNDRRRELLGKNA